MPAHANPFLGPVPSEVPLEGAPLIRVISQVQFPAQLSLVERTTVSELQKALAASFPILEEQSLRSFVFALNIDGQEGRVQPQTLPQPQWRFFDPEANTALVVNTTSITLDTLQYPGRKRFFERFRTCLDIIHARSPINMASRLGVRYVDRVSDEHLQAIPSLINPLLLGLSGADLGIPVQADMHDFLVELGPERGSLHVRHGFLPPGGTMDPDILPPLAVRNWILDIDLFRQGEMFPFEPQAIGEDAIRFAERIYAVFRWIVTDDFLRAFGGKP